MGPPRQTRWLLTLAGLCAVPVAWAGHSAWSRLFSQGGEHPVVIGPVPEGLSSTDARACGDCHGAIAREWRASLHARAWSDPVVQEAYALEPFGPCRNCHAPENTVRTGGRVGTSEVPRGVAARDGVSCAACHVRDGKVLTGPGSGHDFRANPAPHPVEVTAELSGSTFCASCHQFGFFTMIGGRHVETDEVQQDTYGEWLQSDASRLGQTCQDCHMPWVEAPGSGPHGRYRSHAFIGAFDAGFVRRAVSAEVRATLAGDGGVAAEVRFVPGQTGHAFPTGDMFRRAELKVWIDGLPDATATHVLGRTFKSVREPGFDGTSHVVRREVRDTRVPPPGTGPPAWRPLVIPASRLREALTRARLSALPEGATLRWTFDYQLMPTRGATPHSDKPFHTVRIDAGAVPLVRPTDTPPAPQGEGG